MSHLGVLTSPLTSTHTQTKIEKTAHLYRTLRFSCRKPCSPAIGEIYLFWKPQSAIWHFENETFHITSDITCLVQRSSLTLNIGEMEKMKGRMTETSLIEHIPYFWPATFRVKRIALEKEIWPSSVADQHLLFRPVFINYTILPQGDSRRHASIPSSTPQALIAKYCPALPFGPVFNSPQKSGQLFGGEGGLNALLKDKVKMLWIFVYHFIYAPYTCSAVTLLIYLHAFKYS